VEGINNNNTVQVQENYTDLTLDDLTDELYMESTSYTYWMERDKLPEGRRPALGEGSVKVTENYLSLDGITPDLGFIESLYYAYYVSEDGIGKLVLERFEGKDIDKLIRTSVEKRYASRTPDGIHAGQKTETYAPDAVTLIGIRYTYKLRDNVTIEGQQKERVITVNETYMQDDTTLLTTDYTYNIIYEITAGDSKINVLASITDTYEAGDITTGIHTSVRRSYRVTPSQAIKLIDAGK
jgi:hypothetical protein